MAYSILPILGFYQFGMVGSTLPDWYTNYYSQEDRLKSVAKVMQRLIAWDDLALQKINEVVESVNNLGAADVTALLEQIEDISQDISNTNNSINSINSLINSINEDLENLENSQTDLSTNQDSLNTKISTLEGKVTAVENGLSSSIIKVGTVEGNLTTLSTKVDGIVLDLSDLEDNYDGLIQTVSNHSTTLSSLTETMATLEGRISTNESNINDLMSNSGGGSGGDNPELESRIADLEYKQYEIIDSGGVSDDSGEPFESLVTLTQESSDKMNEISDLSSTVQEIIHKSFDDDGSGWIGLVALLDLVNNSSGGSGGDSGGEIPENIQEEIYRVEEIANQAADYANQATNEATDALNYGLNSDAFLDVLSGILGESGGSHPSMLASKLVEIAEKIGDVSQIAIGEPIDDNIIAELIDLKSRVEQIEMDNTDIISRLDALEGQ